VRTEEERFCSNCREELPRDATACPACGVFAGDVFDGKVRRKREPRKSGGILGIVLLLIVAGAAWWWWTTQHPVGAPATTAVAEKPIRVVGDRPGGVRRARGAKLNEAEAILTLRRKLAAQHQLKNECIAVLSHGNERGAYVLSAVDSCAGTKLGRWRVDAQSGAVRAGNS
jgi:hypothetical protein